MNILSMSVIIVGTIGIVYFSYWSSLQEKRYHGILRFFAFESVFLLVVLQASVWFRNPFSFQQIISWIFLTLSIFLFVYSFYFLRLLGKSQGKMENTTHVIIVGAYKYIRHPMYASLLFFGIGAFLKNISVLSLFLLLLDIVSVYMTGKIEENEMVSRFHKEYIKYMKRTKMFIPFIW